MKHETVKEEPYFLMYGRRMLLPIDLEEIKENVDQREQRIEYLIDQQQEYEQKLINQFSEIIMSNIKKELNGEKDLVETKNLKEKVVTINNKKKMLLNILKNIKI
uniref:Uncharacterized protein n=1 Tax=Strongyloides stercoralis TaxID=6248 RepID=A0A0K0EA68_STRER